MQRERAKVRTQRARGKGLEAKSKRQRKIGEGQEARGKDQEAKNKRQRVRCKGKETRDKKKRVRGNGQTQVQRLLFCSNSFQGQNKQDLKHFGEFYLISPIFI